eukprot:134023_1
MNEKNREEFDIIRLNANDIIIEEKQEQFDRIIVPETWGKNEKNPDFLLMTMRASNLGYQSKMSIESGSYFISALYHQIKWNLSTKKNKFFLGDIFEKIQKKLHDKCQLPQITANNGSQYIKFRENKNQKETEIKHIFVSRSIRMSLSNNEYKRVEDGINRDRLQPVPDTMIKYDEINKDIPDLGRNVLDIPHESEIALN